MLHYWNKSAQERLHLVYCAITSGNLVCKLSSRLSLTLFLRGHLRGTGHWFHYIYIYIICVCVIETARIWTRFATLKNTPYSQDQADELQISVQDWGLHWTRRRLLAARRRLCLRLLSPRTQGNTYHNSARERKKERKKRQHTIFIFETQGETYTQNPTQRGGKQGAKKFKSIYITYICIYDFSVSPRNCILNIQNNIVFCVDPLSTLTIPYRKEENNVPDLQRYETVILL